MLYVGILAGQYINQKAVQSSPLSFSAAFGVTPNSGPISSQLFFRSSVPRPRQGIILDVLVVPYTFTQPLFKNHFCFCLLFGCLLVARELYCAKLLLWFPGTAPFGYASARSLKNSTEICKKMNREDGQKAQPGDVVFWWQTVWVLVDDWSQKAGTGLYVWVFWNVHPTWCCCPPSSCVLWKSPLLEFWSWPRCHAHIWSSVFVLFYELSTLLSTFSVKG